MFSGTAASNSSVPINEQQKIIGDKFNAWKGSLTQVDNVLVIGIVI
ncbi:MAG: hypothetical protein ACRC3B_19740 [Bacteroidia bacterium]